MKQEKGKKKTRISPASMEQRQTQPFMYSLTCLLVVILIVSTFIFSIMSSKTSHFEKIDVTIDTFDDDDDVASLLPSRKRTNGDKHSQYIHKKTSIQNDINTSESSIMSKYNHINLTHVEKNTTWETAIVSMLVGPILDDRYWLQLKVFEISLRNSGYSGQIYVLYTNDVNIEKTPTKNVNFNLWYAICSCFTSSESQMKK